MEYRGKLWQALALGLGLSTAVPEAQVAEYVTPIAAESLYLAENSFSKSAHTVQKSTQNKNTQKSSKKPKKPKNPLKGSHDALLEQNIMADKYDLSRIEDDKMLERFVRSGYLVQLPRNAINYYLDDGLSDRYAYARPWTKLFIERLASQYYANFREKLKITSAVRTIKNQAVLDRTNPAAAPAKGPAASSHETGSTFDISKKDMSKKGKKWLQKVLGDLDRQGIIEATEERAAFHTMVYKDRYLSYVRGKK